MIPVFENYFSFLVAPSQRPFRGFLPRSDHNNPVLCALVNQKIDLGQFYCHYCIGQITFDQTAFICVLISSKNIELD